MGSIIAAAIGGAIIGVSSALFLLFGGRVCGISGIVGGSMDANADQPWRVSFIGGLLAGGFLMFQMTPTAFGQAPQVPLWGLVVAGLLVGFGTRLGSGCTSGHGVCGISRFSKRSIIATMVFMAVAMATVFVMGRIGA